MSRSVVARGVIRDDHVRISYLPERLHEHEHVHVPLVRIDFLEFVSAADDVAVVDEVNLFSFIEIA